MNADRRAFEAANGERPAHNRLVTYENNTANDYF